MQLKIALGLLLSVWDYQDDVKWDPINQLINYVELDVVHNFEFIRCPSLSRQTDITKTTTAAGKAQTQN